MDSNEIWHITFTMGLLFPAKFGPDW